MPLRQAPWRLHLAAEVALAVAGPATAGEGNLAAVRREFPAWLAFQLPVEPRPEPWAQERFSAWQCTQATERHRRPRSRLRRPLPQVRLPEEDSRQLPAGRQGWALACWARQREHYSEEQFQSQQD